MEQLITDDDIKWIKRQLKDYGYYSKRIKECQIKLEKIALDLRDNYKPSGIDYSKELKGSSNHDNSLVNQLIHEEVAIEIEQKKWQQMRDELKLDDILNSLSEEQRKIIELHFFEGYSQWFISANTSYGCRETIKYKIKKILLKMLKIYPRVIDK